MHIMLVPITFTLTCSIFFVFPTFMFWIFVILYDWIHIMLGLDVVRTDRTLVFYEKQENLAKLWDILAVYAWIDTDIGYCQGGLSNELYFIIVTH